MNFSSSSLDSREAGVPVRLARLGRTYCLRHRGWWTALLLLVLMIAARAQAQTVTIGSPALAGATNGGGPLVSGYGGAALYSRHAYLYTAVELGLPNGAVITRLDWVRANNVVVGGTNAFQVLLANSGATALPASAAWANLTAGAVAAYSSGNQQVTGGTGSYFGVPTAGFSYAGGSLYVLTDWAMPVGTASPLTFAGNTITGKTLRALKGTPLTAADALSDFGAGVNKRPTLRISYVPGSPCAGTPAAGVATASPASLCSGNGAGLSLSGGSIGAGIGYQWQSSATGAPGSYAPVAGATDFGYQTPPLTASTWYRVLTSCVNGGLSAASAAVQVQVVNPPTYATAPYAMTFEVGWQSKCGTNDAPANEWRNALPGGNLSWRRDDDGASAGWAQPTTYGYAPAGSDASGPASARSARFHTAYAQVGQTGSLDLHLNLGGGGATPLLEFDYIEPSTAGAQLDVLVSADGGQTFGPAVFTKATQATWGHFSVLLTGANSATTVLRFRATGDYNNFDMGLDNVALTRPACPPPTAVAVGGVTNAGATVSFAAPAGSVRYVLNGGAAVSGQSSPLALSGLAASTNYTLVLTQACGGGVFSASATVNFRTKGPNPTFASLPYVQGFENAWTDGDATRDRPDAHWNNAPATGDAAWRRDDDGSSANWSYPVYGGVSPEGSDAAGGASGHSARFHSIFTGDINDLNLHVNLGGGGGQVPVLTFDYAGGDGGDLFRVFVSSDGGNTFAPTPLLELAPTVNAAYDNAAWTRQTVALPTASATYVVRFEATGSGGGGSVDYALDNVDVRFVACPAPSYLAATALSATGATIGFTGTGPASGGYRYVLNGGAPVVVAAGATSFTVSGLLPGTTNTLVMTSNCGGAGNSASSLTLTFQTLLANDDPAGAIALPLTTSCAPATGTNVNAATTAPNGYTNGNANGDDCAQAENPFDVWYKFTTAVSGRGSTFVYLSSTAGALRAFSAGSAAGPFTAIGCSGDGSGTGTANAAPLHLTGLTPATTYYVRVAGFYDNSVTGPFTICALDTAPALPDLTVTVSNGLISGAYHNVTIATGGAAQLTGPLSVSGTLTVSATGILDTNCQPISGGGSFVLSSGGSLSICDPAGISLSGQTGAVRVTGSRAYDPDASYTYTGTAAQVTGPGLPGSPRALTVKNPAGVTLTGPATVRQLLELNGGDLNTGGQMLTLASASTGTAVVVNTSGVVNGTATVQRYLNPGLNPGLGYRHYAAPVAATTLADLTTTTGFVPLLNTAYNTVGNTATPFPNVFRYDQSFVSAGFDQGWRCPASPAEVMQPGRGYTVNIGGGNLVDFVGTLNNGAVALPLGGNGGTAASGWHLLGNPYPAPIDWRNVTLSPDLDAAVHVFRSSGPYGGTYRSFVNGIGTNPLIGTAQGFFVRVNTPGATPALTLTNACRVTTPAFQDDYGSGANASFQRTAADPRPQLHLNVAAAAGAPALGADDTYVYFEAGATPAFDARLDAAKLRNPGLTASLFTRTGLAELSINALPALGANTADVVVPLGLAVPATTGRLTLTASTLQGFAGVTAVYLRDALTNALINLSRQPTYDFQLSGPDAGTRFSLVFRANAALASQVGPARPSLEIYPNPARAECTLRVPPTAAHTATVQLINALGQRVLTRTLPLTAGGTEARLVTATLPPGVYTLRLQAGTEAPQTQRLVLE